MEQLLAHLAGDYLLQNRWMATQKTKYWTPAIAHGVVYTLPFLLLTQSWLALVIIALTHILIDHYRLAKIIMWVNDWFGSVQDRHTLRKFRKLSATRDMPEWRFFWLMIIVDNTMHLLINYVVIKYVA